VRRLAAALVLAGLLAAGCGGASNRDRVRTYIDRANAVESRAAPALQQANLAYAEFSQGKLSGDDAVRALQGAEGTLRDTRTKLGALTPPAAARRLHAALLAAVGASIGLAGESTMLARYTPGAQAVATRLKSSAAELRTSLGRAKDPTAQAAALETYRSRLAAVSARLRRLTPPPILAASHRAQLARLAGVRVLAGRLRTAIRERDSRRLAKLLIRFRRAGASSPSAAALSRKALLAYQRRSVAAARAGAAVRREQQRLDAKLR
jgi:hypothetical protein